MQQAYNLNLPFMQTESTQNRQAHYPKLVPVQTTHMNVMLEAVKQAKMDKI